LSTLNTAHHQESVAEQKKVSLVLLVVSNLQLWRQLCWFGFLHFYLYLIYLPVWLTHKVSITLV